jgi:hypothetical protein
VLARRKATAALVVWTFLVWTTRIGNILRDDTLSSSGKASALALAVSFTAFVVLTTRAIWRRQPAGGLVIGFAAWTIGVWAVKGVDILRSNHSVAFIAVHTVLGLVSIALALLTLRELTANRAVSSVAHPG